MIFTLSIWGIYYVYMTCVSRLQDSYHIFPREKRITILTSRDYLIILCTPIHRLYRICMNEGGSTNVDTSMSSMSNEIIYPYTLTPHISSYPNSYNESLRTTSYRIFYSYMERKRQESYRASRYCYWVFCILYAIAPCIKYRIIQYNVSYIDTHIYECPRMEKLDKNIS